MYYGVCQQILYEGFTHCDSGVTWGTRNVCAGVKPVFSQSLCIPGQ